MSHSPYTPPVQKPSHQPKQPVGTPAAYWVYCAYCAFVALIYLVAIVAGMLLIFNAEAMAEADRDVDDPALFVVMGALVAVVCTPFFFAFVYAPFAPRNRFGWIVGIIAIAIGVTSGCTIIPAVILLVMWLQPTVKDYYGM